MSSARPLIDQIEPSPRSACVDTRDRRALYLRHADARCALASDTTARDEASPKSLIALEAHVNYGYIIALLACWLGECCVAVVNPDVSIPEKLRLLHDLQPSLTMLQPGSNLHEHIEQQHKLRLRRHGLVVYGPRTTLARGIDVVQDGDALIIQTSGSTGMSKGVVLTYRSLAANAHAVADYLSLSNRDRTVVFTPPAYAYAVSQVLSHLLAGGTIYSYTAGMRFPAHLLNIISGVSATGVSTNPTSVRIFRRLPANHITSLNKVRYLMLGGQPLDLDLVKDARKIFPSVRVVNMYGCTENSPRITYHWVDLSRDYPPGPLPVGRAVSGTRIDIQPTAKDHEAGQIIVSGDSIFSRYWGQPDTTRTYKPKKDSFQTGDSGYVDSDRNLVLTGRQDDVILVGHQKVGPEEIEAVINSIRGVRECAVAGRSDSLLYQVPVAWVILDEPRRLTSGALEAACRSRLKGVRMPRRIFVVEDLPHTLYGKLDRAALKIMAEDL